MTEGKKSKRRKGFAEATEEAADKMKEREMSRGRKKGFRHAINEKCHFKSH